jgi:hypothetical protein
VRGIDVEGRCTQRKAVELRIRSTPVLVSVSDDGRVRRLTALDGEASALATDARIRVALHDPETGPTDERLEPVAPEAVLERAATVVTPAVRSVPRMSKKTGSVRCVSGSPAAGRKPSPAA